MSIVLDLIDSSDMEDIEDDCVLESVSYVNQKKMDKNNFNYICKEKPLLAKFIEKCYDIENSQGMSQVINKTLIKYYNETNKAYKISSDFEKVLKKSISMLETDPGKIYSHIRQLCDILVSSSVTRRIKPTTLSTNVKDNCPKIVENGILKRKNSSGKISKVPKVYIIESDEVEDLTEEHQPIDNNIEKLNSITDSEKENKSINELEGEEDNKLLVPQKVIEIDDIRDPLNIEKVKKIEKEIARCKTVISKLDEQEVDEDSVNSPYIKSEKLKAKIVLLYEQLCNFTGNQPVKKRNINLRVIEGHPEGPVRRLESFLNNNIGPDGVPPFPDFSDVIECVAEANSEDNLGWTKHQILQEARALFIQCGRALQRRRQNREWQDLLYKVRLQRCDEDPADSDPALLKRLEENKRAAVKKESEILERYSMMQTVPQTHATVSKNKEISTVSKDKEISTVSKDQEISTVSKDIEISKMHEGRPLDESMLEQMNLYNSVTSHNLFQDKEAQTSATEEDEHAVLSAINKIEIKKEPEEEIEKLLEELGDNYTLTIIEMDEDPFLIIEVSDSSDEEGS